MSRPARQIAAFSLVEVTLALGIMSFCLVAIFGLLPTGLNTSRDAMSQTAAANIAGAIAADLRLAPAATGISPRYQIAVPTPSNGQRVVHTLFLTEDGAVVGTQDQSADASKNPQYRATMVFSRQNATSTDRTATGVRLLITWPALADPTGGTLPQKVGSSFETMIALDRN